MEDEAEDLDTSTRQRIEAVARSLERRCVLQVNAWRSMLESLSAETPKEFVDFFEVERISGRDFDIGMHRHWQDRAAIRYWVGQYVMTSISPADDRHCLVLLHRCACRRNGV